MAKEKQTQEITNEPVVTFDCVKCPSFCCTTYDYVEVSYNDMRLIAEQFGIDVDEAIKKYTNPSELAELDTDPQYQLKKVEDVLLDRTCIFLNQKTRLCGVHEARPDVCRDWNGVVEDDKRVCHFYNLYKFTEEEQGKDYLPLIQIQYRKWKKKDRPEL